MSLTSRRGTFSVGFTAADDEAALAHVARWLERNGFADSGTVRIVGPDGREVLHAEASSCHALSSGVVEPGADAAVPCDTLSKSFDMARHGVELQ